MDAVDLTRLFDEAHPDGVTWESHLALVEQMARWDVDRLVDVHESLIAHVVAGSWTIGFSGLTLPSPLGGVISTIDIDARIDALREAIERMRVAPEGDPNVIASLRTAEVEFRGLTEMERPAVEKVAPPPDVVAFPVRDGFVESVVRSSVERDGKASRRRVLGVLNDEAFANARGLVRILRTAAWAYHRSTGLRLRGVLPNREEELHSTGGNRVFTVVHLLRRGDDRVETVQRRVEPSLDYLRARMPALAPVARALDARVVGPARITDIGAALDRGDSPTTMTSTMVEEWPSGEEPANALLDDARALLSGELVARTVSPMDEDSFWGLIEHLAGAAANTPDLVDALARRPPDDIPAFAESLAAALFELDRPELMNDPDDPSQIPMSEDVFLSFRCSIVAAGRAAHARVLAEAVIREAEWPDDGEELLGAAPSAWELATGREWDHEAQVSVETGSNTAAWGPRRPPQHRGGDNGTVAVAVRSRSTTEAGEVDTVRLWRSGDPAEARAAHLAVEESRDGRTRVRILDHLRRSSRSPTGILAAPVDWVRHPVGDGP